MKLFGFEVSKFADNKKPRVLASGVELGGSGTQMWDGIITEEYNADLRGAEGFKEYDKMRRNDATVKSAILSVTLPIRRAKWYVKPASDSPEDIERADFITWNMFEGLSSTYDDFIRQACLHLVFGNMVFEKVFNVRPWEGKEMVTWEKFGPRLPRTIVRWETKDKAGIEQLLHDGRQVIIPWEKLMVFVNEMEGDNWEGISILRAAYKHWYYKDKFYLIDAMAFERQGLGIPKAKLGEGASQEDTEKAKTILKNIRANHQQYVVEPYDVTLEFMDMKAQTTRDPANSIGHHNREITKSVLAQFLELGATDSGSRALSEDQSSLFLLSLETVANNICDVINRFAIKQLIDMNYDGVQYYPTLEYAGISRVDVAKLSSAYEVLTRSGGIKSQGEDERYLREIMGLPERDIEEDETPTEEVVETPDPEDLPKEEDEVKKKEASYPRFTEEYKGWRPLTFAEKKVAFSALEREIDRLEKSLVGEAGDVLRTEKDKYIKALSTALHSNDPAKAKEVKFKAATTYAKVLRDHQRGALTYGKTSASSEIGKAIPATTAEQKALIDMQSTAIAESHITTLDEKAKIAAVNARTRGETVAIAVAAADRAAEEAISKLLDDTAKIVVSSYINNGRDYVFDTYKEEVYALQRSELLDSRTCNYCLSVDGRVIERDDSFGRSGPYHSGCRGIWVSILKDEDEKPSITGVPKSLRDKYGDSVNDVVQPKSPTNVKDSAAKSEIDKRKSK